MDLIDQLIYTASTNLRNYGPLRSPALPQNANYIGGAFNNNTYDPDVRAGFIFNEDSTLIETSIEKHWLDLNHGPIASPAGGGVQMFQPLAGPPYHLIFAYLIENTRVHQIIEKLLLLYQQDETLGISDPGSMDNRRAFQWLMNTEDLFFKTLSSTRYRNIASQLRPNTEMTRRNAYYRLFGMELAFGISSLEGPAFHKAMTANTQFIALFEQFLMEAWQAYINARNSSGENRTDYQKLIDMIIKLRQMLMARRGSSGYMNLQNYRLMNLSREEFSSVVQMTWYYYIISHNSPVVNFLGCQANTTAERLANMGKRVGIAAHSKSQALMDMSVAMAVILAQIEYGTFEGTVNGRPWIQGTIESRVNGIAPAPLQSQIDGLRDILTVINNWEISTGHRIKTQEPNIASTLKSEITRAGMLMTN